MYSRYFKKQSQNVTMWPQSGTLLSYIILLFYMYTYYWFIYLYHFCFMSGIKTNEE